MHGHGTLAVGICEAKGDTTLSKDVPQKNSCAACGQIGVGFEGFAKKNNRQSMQCYLPV
jgi:hypothetical protein